MSSRRDCAKDLLLRELRAAVADRSASGATAEEVTAELLRRLRRLRAASDGTAGPCSGRIPSAPRDTSEL